MSVFALIGTVLALTTYAPLAPTAERREHGPELTDAGRIALVGGRIIDGTGRRPIVPGTILIEAERIRAVGEATSVTVPPDALRIDVTGKTVLPGFVNAHVHLTFTHVGRGRRSRWVAEGVTTVCDLAAPVEQIASLKNSAAGDPRVVVAGPIVSVPGGYPASHWGPGIHLSVQGPEDAGRKVNALIDRGADVIKIALERAGSSRLPVLSDQEIRAIVRAAHARAVPVLAHVDVAENLERAVDTGVDTAAHMIRDPLPDALIRKMVAKDFSLIPTLAVLSDDGDGQRLMEDNLRRFVAAGGKVAFGDDWGNTGTATGMPWYELRLYQRAGMSPMQIIVSASQHSARACNLDRDRGTLEPGKLADLFVVTGDPVDDLGALKQVALVLKGGRVIVRGESE